MSQALNSLVAQVRDEFPTFSIVKKSESTFMKVLDVCLRILTFNRMTSFMSRFTTTIGYKVYVTDRWEQMTDEDQIRILRHESVHMRQRAKYGFLLFSILYLLLPLPMFFAGYRTKFEKEAYVESMRVEVEQAGSLKPLLNNIYRETMIERFTGPSYGWMWCRRGDIEDWYDGVVRKLTDERRD